MAVREALVAVPGQPHLLKAILLAGRGASLALSSSLETPRADRAPRRALLWAAGNDFYSGFEADAVAAVLAAAGVEVDRRGCKARSRRAVPAQHLRAARRDTYRGRPTPHLV